jgi:hypothetical protein
MNALAPPELPDLDARVRSLRGPLLAELRPRRRRAPLRALAAAALAAVVALTVAGITRDPALAVERQDGWLVFTIHDASAGEAELTRELREAGIRGEVRSLPVPADRAGTWAVIAEHADPNGAPPPRDRPVAPRPESVVRLNRVVYERETLRIPIDEVRESTGYFVFYVGREARPGEDLWGDGDFFYGPTDK